MVIDARVHLCRCNVLSYNQESDISAKSNVVLDGGTGTNEYIAAAANIDEDMASLLLANKMDSSTGIQNEGMLMSKVDFFVFVRKQRWQPSKRKNNQPAMLKLKQSGMSTGIQNRHVEG